MTEKKTETWMWKDALQDVQLTVRRLKGECDSVSRDLDSLTKRIDSIIEMLIGASK